MALSGTLTAEFGSGGFSVDATFTGLDGDLGNISIPDVPLDASSIDAAVAGLQDTSTSEVFGAVQIVVDALGAAGLEIPVFDDIIAPLQSAIELGLELTESLQVGSFGSVFEAGADISGVGIDALQQRIGAVTDSLAGPEIMAGLGLIEQFLPDSIDLDGTLNDLLDWFATIKVLICAVAGLMGTEGASREIRDGVELVLSMMRPTELTALLARVGRWSGRGLADLLVGIDPEDQALVDLIAPPILELTADIRVAAEAMTRGLGFGQATLVGLDFAALEGRLEAAANLLVETGLDGVRSLAEQLVSLAGPILNVTLPDPIDSLESFAGLLQGQVGTIASAVESLDPNRLSNALTGGMQPVLDVIGTIRTAAEEVVVLAQSAFDGIDDLIDAIDLAPITEKINALLAPIQEVIDAITTVVADAETAIGDVSAAVVDAMDVVRGLVAGAAAAISTAFGRIQTELDKLKIAEIQAAIEVGLAPIADALASARVKPFFDTANDIIDTTATVVGAIPLGLLPDDAKADLAEAVRPVKEINFQRDVADVLNAKMAEILEQLDTSVLGAIEIEYQKVITFLEELDPSVPIAKFETDVFDPFLAELAKVNPSEILKPLEDAIAPVKEAIGQFSIDDELLAPIETAIDQVAAQLTALSPVELIAPMQASIDEIRTTVTTQLRLEDIDGWLDTAEATIVSWFDRMDPARFIAALDTAYGAIIADVARGSNGVGLGGSIIVSMMQGAGLTMRTDSFETAVQWILGEVGSSVVAGRLGQAAASLGVLRDAVSSVDLPTVVAGLQPEWRSLHEAVIALPEGSRLRVAVELDVQASDPQVLLAPFVDAQQSYATELGEAAAALQRLAVSERSAIDAVAAGIRNALRPLSAFPEWIRALLSRFGLDPAGKSMGEILLELLRAFTPGQLLEPLVTALETLVGNFQTAASTGLLAPARTIVADVRAALDAIDIGIIVTEVEEVFDAIVAKLDQLRPSVALGPTLDSLTALQTELADFDPLGPVKIAVDAITTAIDEGTETLRPSVILAPAIEIYDTVIGLVGALNVRAMLDPLLISIEGIAADLGEGIDGTAVALKKLQDALPDAASLGAGGGASASVSVSVGLG